MPEASKAVGALAVEQPPPSGPPPWERQEGEGSKEFTAFVTYRDLQPKDRSVDHVREILYPGSAWQTRTLRDWAKQFNWNLRVIAWENELDRLRRESMVKGRTEMQDLHQKAARLMVKKGIEALEKMTPETLQATDIRQYIVEGAKLERLSRDMSTEKIDDRKPGLADLASKSESELRRLAEDTDGGEERTSET